MESREPVERYLVYRLEGLLSASLIIVMFKDSMRLWRAGSQWRDI
jgi:hypothetical protein